MPNQLECMMRNWKWTKRFKTTTCCHDRVRVALQKNKMTNTLKPYFQGLMYLIKQILIAWFHISPNFDIYRQNCIGSWGIRYDVKHIISSAHSADTADIAQIDDRY